MSYSYQTEKLQYVCKVCGHYQYSVNDICLKCLAKYQMYHRHKCKICGEMIEGENARVTNKKIGSTTCRDCDNIKRRKTNLKNYYVKRLREGKL